MTVVMEAIPPCYHIVCACAILDLDLVVVTRKWALSEFPCDHNKIHFWEHSSAGETHWPFPHCNSRSLHTDLEVLKEPLFASSKEVVLKCRLRGTDIEKNYWKLWEENIDTLEEWIALCYFEKKSPTMEILGKYTDVRKWVGFVLPPNTYTNRVLHTPFLPGLVDCLHRAGKQARPGFPWQCHRCCATAEEWAAQVHKNRKMVFVLLFHQRWCATSQCVIFPVHCKQNKCFEMEDMGGDITEFTCTTKKASSKSGMRE